MDSGEPEQAEVPPLNRFFREEQTGMKLGTIVLALAAALSTHAFAEQAPPSAEVMVGTAPGKGAVVGTVELRGTVVSVDKAKRAVTVKGPKGNEKTLIAGDEVKNFDQIKAGDEIVLKYVEALALELKKGGGGKVERTEVEEGARAKPGEKPAGVVGRQVTVTADVIAVDAKNQMVTLRGPERTVELKIKDPEQFKNIKKGDQIQATYTEALAIGIEAAPKKK